MNYFEKLKHLVTNKYMPKRYDILLEFLFNAPFVSTLPNDIHREQDVRAYRIANDAPIDIINSQVSILEILICLALRYEDITLDTRYGTRIGTWFWEFIGNMGLAHMDDDNFDINYVTKVITMFINREYTNEDPTGCIVRSNQYDINTLAQTELWYQMCYSINSMEE